MCLFETWCIDNEAVEQIKNKLCNFTVHNLCALKKVGKGRPSGGVLVLIKKTRADYFEKIQINYRYGLIFNVNKVVHGEPVIFIATYLPPFGSSAYGIADDNGIDLLNEELVRLKSKYPEQLYFINW